jgi:hypothetical protein
MKDQDAGFVVNDECVVWRQAEPDLLAGDGDRYVRFVVVGRHAQHDLRATAIEGLSKRFSIG